jgi:hypothetical protein
LVKAVVAGKARWDVTAGGYNRCIFDDSNQETTRCSIMSKLLPVIVLLNAGDRQSKKYVKNVGTDPPRIDTQKA